VNGESFAQTTLTETWTPKVLIDGLNVAHWVGRHADLRLPLRLLAELQGLQVPAELYFDASAPHRFGEARALYESARLASPRIIEVPSGRRADGTILQRARSTGASIVTRDRFRDYRSKFRKLIDEPGRLIGGHVSNDVLFIPALAIEVALHTAS